MGKHLVNKTWDNAFHLLGVNFDFNGVLHHDGEELFEFKTGDGQVIEGLHKAMMTMKKGEITLLTCNRIYI